MPGRPQLSPDFKVIHFCKSINDSVYRWLRWWDYTIQYDRHNHALSRGPTWVKTRDLPWLSTGFQDIVTRFETWITSWVFKNLMTIYLQMVHVELYVPWLCGFFLSSVLHPWRIWVEDLIKRLFILHSVVYLVNHASNSTICCSYLKNGWPLVFNLWQHMWPKSE